MLTYVGFRAHVKIAYRIVSYRIVLLTDYLQCMSRDRYLNKHIYVVHVTVWLLCVFSEDNEQEMPVKQITSFTVRGEIQTATVTFIAC